MACAEYSQGGESTVTRAAGNVPLAVIPGWPKTHISLLVAATAMFASRLVAIVPAPRQTLD